jgi:hypothetical protein
MPAVSDLVVRLGATTAPFDKKMRHSQGILAKFRGGVGRLAGSLRGLSGLFLGLSAGGMAAMIKQNLDLMDSTGKMADRIGIATEKLIGLRHAAELTGAGADTLDAGLITMAKRLGEAARGAGAAKPALELIGIQIKDIIALSPDEQFIAIAEAISRLPTATERAAAAANIFSKGNMELINTLAEGREGIEGMISEAERLGMTFDRETAAKAEAANDALTRLSGTMKGSMTQAVGDLADEIEILADALGKLPKLARQFRGEATRFRSPMKGMFGLAGIAATFWEEHQNIATGGESQRQL